jgi:hypothetical protein
VPLAVPVVQLALLLLAIWTRTAAVPYWDEWATVDLVSGALGGRLTWATLWYPHAYAHRIVLPRLLDLAVIVLTGWNRQVELTVDLAIAAATLVLILATARRTLDRKVWRWLVPVLSLLLLSGGAYANWFAPFQVQYLACVAGSALCLHALARPAGSVRVRHLLLAGAGALVATLSSLHGLCAWPAFAPAVWASGSTPRQRRVRTLVWSLTGAGAWTLYLLDFPFGAGGSPTGGLQGLMLARQALRYLLVWLGAPLGYPDALHAALWGLASVCLALIIGWALYRYRPLVPGLAGWIGLVLFAGGSALATLAGRLSAGPGEALFSRYQAFSVLWWVGLLVLAAAALQPVRIGRWVRRTAVVPCAALLVALLTVNVAGWHDGLVWQDTQRANQGWIGRAAAGATVPASCLALYYPDPVVLHRLVLSLRAQRLGLFASTPFPPPPTGHLCAKPYAGYLD